MVRSALEGVNIVIHAAAALPLYDPADIFSTEVDGTRIVLEEALRKNVERVIHFSSTAAYGIPDHHPLLETDPLQGVGPYGEAKVPDDRLFSVQCIAAEWPEEAITSAFAICDGCGELVVKTHQVTCDRRHLCRSCTDAPNYRLDGASITIK